ncbi:hypothetical protein K7X08_011974 [Anisodus acutangulus]|uniref:Uncharacterized protein n=1 Tax=Anisodus acutangulus TaxID=402998 RepID=A0A9Q1LAS0_9SOLA|nr:hypothetical protein K7X08_011974 [Anisodus acutangulus]
MIVALMTGSRINVGEIIQDEIQDQIQQKNTSLPYPCLITTLFQKAGVSRIDGIDRYTEPKQMVDYTRLEHVYQPIPADASVTISTSVLEVPTPTTETALAIYVATSSAPSVGLGIPSHGMRLIRLTEAKVNKLIEEFPAYVKEAIETTLAPHKENLEAVREE